MRRVRVGHSFLKAKQSRDGSMKYTLLKIYALDLYHYNAVSQKKKMYPKCLGNSLNWSSSS